MSLYQTKKVRSAFGITLYITGNFFIDVFHMFLCAHLRVLERGLTQRSSAERIYLWEEPALYAFERNGGTRCLSSHGELQRTILFHAKYEIIQK